MYSGVIFFIALAACIAVIRVNQPTIDYADEPVLFKDVSEIAFITVDIVPKNWDDDPEKDGFMLHITFYDEQNNSIMFKDTEYAIRLKIFEMTDPQSAVKGELLYDMCCPPVKKIGSSAVREPNGVKMILAFSDAVEWVFVEVEVEIPGVGTFSGADEVPLH